jgi:hypothetical protein
VFERWRLSDAAVPEDREHADRLVAETIGDRHDAAFGDIVGAELVTDLHVRCVERDRIRDEIVERLLLFDHA